MRAPTSPTIAQADEAAREGAEKQRRQGELELDAMTDTDEEEAASSAGAPLLHSARDYGSGAQSPPTARDDGERFEGEAETAAESSYSQRAGTWFVWALTLSAGISGLLFGYDTAVISSTLVSIGSDLSRELTILDKSLITSCTSLFALIASPLAGAWSDKLGRKPVIVIADSLFVLGALWQSATSTVWGMIVGRSLVGLAVGAASLVTPLYISELSPSAMRGRLVTMLSLFLTGGQVVAYVIGWLLSSLPGGWRWMVGLGSVPALVQLLIVLFFPETPRWLVRANRMQMARQVLRRVYSDAEDTTLVVDEILHGIGSEIHEEEEETQKPMAASATTGILSHHWTSLFQIGYNRRALTIACMLQGLQQLTGFNSLMYYSATLFSMLAFSSPTSTSLSVAVTNFLFTLLAFTLIDRIGRRRILLYSIPIMTAALLLCALAFSTLDLDLSATNAALDSNKDGDNNNNANDRTTSAGPILIVLALTIYTASYACGIGTIPWQQSELFPLAVRSLGSALATATNWASNFVIGLTFLPLMQWISPGWTFVLYAVVCSAGWVAVWVVYPEMSGLGLEDVRGLLAEGWGVQESLRRFEMRKERHVDL